MAKNEPVQINRDPFARASLMRRSTFAGHLCSCKWCGGPGRFEYAWEADRIRPVPLHWEGPFCGVGCYRTYTG